MRTITTFHSVRDTGLHVWPQLPASFHQYLNMEAHGMAIASVEGSGYSNTWLFGRIIYSALTHDQRFIDGTRLRLVDPTNRWWTVGHHWKLADEWRIKWVNLAGLLATRRTTTNNGAR